MTLNCEGMAAIVVYYESIKRELKIRGIYDAMDAILTVYAIGGYKSFFFFGEKKFGALSEGFTDGQSN